MTQKRCEIGPMPRERADDDVPDDAIDRIVAVGFLTEHDLTVLGQGFRRAYRLPHDHEFADLLEAIDRADLRLRSK